MRKQPVTVPVEIQIAQRAVRQHGVVSVKQLLALGLTHSAIAHRARSGRLHRVHRGVYAVGYPRLSGKGRYMAAVLTCGPAAVLSHVSAADLWELRSSSARSIHVTAPTAAGRGRRDGLVVHRARTLHADEVTVHDAIPITIVARTLLDVAGDLEPRRLQRAVEQSVILRRFDLGEVRATLARPNHTGARALAAIVADLQDEPQLTPSELERFFEELCDARRLPRPQINVRVEGLVVDFLWSDRRLIVETDGRERHGTAIAFERDRTRDATLTVAGYRVVRLTYGQIVHEPGGVARKLVALLAAGLAA